VDASSPIRVAVNESFYRGWTASFCPTTGTCAQLTATSGPMQSISVTLPSGPGSLRLHYVIPEMATGWWCFGAGAGLAAAFAIGSTIARRRRGSFRAPVVRPQVSPTPTPATPTTRIRAGHDAHTP
jgi:hypothetical protein